MKNKAEIEVKLNNLNTDLEIMRNKDENLIDLIETKIELLKWVLE